MNWTQRADYFLSLYQRWRGTVLNRAGFLLVAAGVGELTSIIQNLISFLFALAKIPVPFADPPPWVGLSLIALGLAALTANRLLPDNSKGVSQQQEAHPRDVQLLRRFQALFSSATMEFLTNQDFSAVFWWHRIHPVQKFVTEWVGPRFEFCDAETEAEFAKVKEAAADLSGMINRYAYPHNRNIDMATTRSENYYLDSEVKKLTDERVARLNVLATALVAKIHNFERVSKISIRAI